MKNKSSKKKIIISILASLVLCLIIIRYVIYNNKNTDIGIMNAVVVKVESDSIYVMEIEEDYSYPNLYSVKYSKDKNTHFKQGQEVKIYYNDEMIMSINPSVLFEVKKVKIAKEKSEVSIPKSVLRFYYSSMDDVNIKVNNITTKNIDFTIKDLNNETFEYSKEYSLYKNGGNKLVSQTANEFYQITEGEELNLNYDWTNKCGELGERKI